MFLFLFLLSALAQDTCTVCPGCENRVWIPFQETWTLVQVCDQGQSAQVTSLKLDSVTHLMNIVTQSPAPPTSDSVVVIDWASPSGSTVCFGVQHAGDPPLGIPSVAVIVTCMDESGCSVYWDIVTQCIYNTPGDLGPIPPSSFGSAACSGSSGGSSICISDNDEEYVVDSFFGTTHCCQGGTSLIHVDSPPGEYPLAQAYCSGPQTILCPGPCDNVNCGTMGTCSFGTCTCSNGYTGSNCQISPPPSPCKDVYCNSPNGICVLNGMCTCYNGWSGNHCETQTPSPSTSETLSSTNKIFLGVFVPIGCIGLVAFIVAYKRRQKKSVAALPGRFYVPLAASESLTGSSTASTKPVPVV